METIVQVKGAKTPDKTRELIWAELRRDFEDWLSAKEDMTWRPAIELTERDNRFLLRAAVAGVDPKNIEIFVAPDIMLIKADLHRDRSEGEVVHRCEFGYGKLSRSIRFPRAINPANVRAEIKDGLLTIKAPIANAIETKYDLPLAA
jgi:HSP20 family protein